MQVNNLLFLNFNQLHFYSGSGLTTCIVFLIIFELYFAKMKSALRISFIPNYVYLFGKVRTIDDETYLPYLRYFQNLTLLDVSNFRKKSINIKYL